MARGVRNRPIEVRCAECNRRYPTQAMRAKFCSPKCQGAYRTRSLGRTPQSNLDGQDYQDIIALRKTGVTYQAIADRYRISNRGVWGIVNEIGGEYLPNLFAKQCDECGAGYEGVSWQRFCVPICANRSAYHRRKLKRAAPSPVLALALRHAINRRLEFTITGYWRGER